MPPPPASSVDVNGDPRSSGNGGPNLIRKGKGKPHNGFIGTSDESSSDEMARRRAPSRSTGPVNKQRRGNDIAGIAMDRERANRSLAENSGSTEARSPISAEARAGRTVSPSLSFRDIVIQRSQSAGSWISSTPRSADSSLPPLPNGANDGEARTATTAHAAAADDEALEAMQRELHFAAEVGQYLLDQNQELERALASARRDADRLAALLARAGAVASDDHTPTSPRHRRSSTASSLAPHRSIPRPLAYSSSSGRLDIDTRGYRDDGGSSDSDFDAGAPRSATVGGTHKMDLLAMKYDDLKRDYLRLERELERKSALLTARQRHGSSTTTTPEPLAPLLDSPRSLRRVTAVPARREESGASSSPLRPPDDTSMIAGSTDTESHEVIRMLLDHVGRYRSQFGELPAPAPVSSSGGLLSVPARAGPLSTARSLPILQTRGLAPNVSGSASSPLTAESGGTRKVKFGLRRRPSTAAQHAMAGQLGPLPRSFSFDGTSDGSSSAADPAPAARRRLGGLSSSSSLNSSPAPLAALVATVRDAFSNSVTPGASPASIARRFSNAGRFGSSPVPHSPQPQLSGPSEDPHNQTLSDLQSSNTSASAAATATAPASSSSPENVGSVVRLMVGGWLFKCNRRRTRTDLRFVSVNPYSRTLAWSKRDPTSDPNAQVNTGITKSHLSLDAHVEDLADGRSRIVVRAPLREIVLECSSREEHLAWERVA
ncbi:hypothetical protein HK405_003155, partial [Cladochytrium tenue]